MGFVTVNAKGLVVIPKTVRDQGGIFPGDKLSVNYDPANNGIVIRKVADVKELSKSVCGMWADNKLGLDAAKAGSNERIEKLLKDKLQQKRTV